MHRGMLTLQSSSTSSGRGRDAGVDVDGVSCEVVFPDERRGRQSGANEELGTSIILTNLKTNQTIKEISYTVVE